MWHGTITGMSKAVRFPRNSVVHFPLTAENLRNGKSSKKSWNRKENGDRGKNGTENRFKELT